ncbi:cell division protein FtsW [Corynebacterium afermentans subsp. lipophilum]|uniref:FtsW/RodA/SpoVE family cell cycle protein n=2 Tax=Corynebacterium afermentans TaxID=38286 RepID=UPI00188B63A5|nr:putative peptidoglycan glycosyltransferase FtsW [Corynebacterium afermentans]MBF4546882.1 cell division protein FtsW [Corynebacterium afermentans subsp. lipophilum]WJY59242.1 Lipid II flippase FtsW [Corynebacterium afermentans subsp. lipophilum]
MTVQRAPRQRAPRPDAPSKLSAGVRRIQEALDSRPLIDYTMIRSIVLFLAGLGVVMVMSSSMATSFASSASVWSLAVRQFAMVILGLIAFWAALKTPPERLRGLSNWLMVIAILLLIAVLTPLGTGRAEVGSQSWLVVGPLRLQPSEFARVAIAMWGAKILSNKDPRRLFVPDNGFAAFISVSLLCVLLIAMQGDMGMALSLAVVVAFILLFAGVSLKAVGVVAASGVVALVVIFLSGSFRSDRFHVYFDALRGHFDDTRGVAFQSHQGFLSLADGHIFGVGLGQSRAKWFYLPEARNDFIFAVIGEELGLWGGALVITLFALLGFFGMRTALRAQTQYQTLMAASLTATVVSQAFINMAYVVGLLPVTGIQLPMLSAGGSSAVFTLGAMGVLASVARHEPDAISSMQNYGRPVFDRIFFIAEPRALKQRRQAPAAAPRRERYGTPVTQPVAAAYHRPPHRRTPRR